MINTSLTFLTVNVNNFTRNLIKKNKKIIYYVNVEYIYDMIIFYRFQYIFYLHVYILIRFLIKLDIKCSLE